MFYQTEAKPQGWRAVAVFDDRGDRLLYLGRSSTQVRAGFTEAFFEVLDEEERDQGARLRSLNARARQLREAARLRLYFTGLEVTRCPGCAATWTTSTSGYQERRAESRHMGCEKQRRGHRSTGKI